MHGTSHRRQLSGPHALRSLPDLLRTLPIALLLWLLALSACVAAPTSSTSAPISAPSPAARAAPLLALDPADAVVPLWPAVRWLPDPAAALDAAGARARLAAFRSPAAHPGTADNTLGLRAGAAWMAVRLRHDGGTDDPWILESAHASLQRLQYTLYGADGQLLAEGRIGALERSHARVPTAVLREQPGWRGCTPMMRAGAAVMLATALLFGMDAIGLAALSAVAGTVGMLPALLSLSRAWRLARRGDATGVCLLLFLQVLLRRQRDQLARAEQAAHEAGQLRDLAQTDPLTRLPNRRGLEAWVHAVLAQARPGHGVALFMIDLDGFKAINDNHGHAVGDRLLAALAQRLRQHTRPGDLLARLGGDEFVLLAKDLLHAGQAQAVGEQLVQALAMPLLADRRDLRLGLTAGGVFVEATEPLEAVLRRANGAMYRGKQAGRGRVELDRAPAPAPWAA